MRGDSLSNRINLRFEDLITGDEMLNSYIPIIFKGGNLMGLFINNQNKNQKLSYFYHKQENQEAPKMKKTVQENKLWKKTVLSYPFLFYTGLTPDCREIVIANLADTNQPQKIIRLPDGLQL